MSQTDYDLIIVGAGISGINAAYRMQTQCPGMSYTILEARDTLGGTWDLFKYPGIRSDSDLHTFGFAWRPWAKSTPLADGASIKAYMTDCARECGIDKKIQYQHTLADADWSSERQRWTLTVKNNGTIKHFSAKFMLYAAGYYDYHQALQVQIPGIENFKGTRVHPQFWPEDLDYMNKNVVIIGSGATAITLLPNLAKKASHVTIVQRSPSYVLSLSSVDPTGNFIRRWLPTPLAFALVRIKYLVVPFLFFLFCSYFPKVAKGALLKRSKQLLPENIPVDPNFNPKYYPWQQRLCVCPDGDFYDCLKTGKGSIVTGDIEMVDEKSIKMKESGQVLQPDVIITATGLKIQLAGGTRITVDKAPLKVNSKYMWRSTMLQDLPNAAIVIGYTNTSWTLGADAAAFLMTRILTHMEKCKIGVAVPRLGLTDPMEAEKMHTVSLMNLNSTYVEKAKGELALAGDRGPWKPRSNYFRDLWVAKWETLGTGIEWIPEVSS